MDTKKIKILYAEDNRITAQETGEALEDNGYEVKTVFDGDEAWLAYQSSRPDVVVLDYQMPGKTGIEGQSQPASATLGNIFEETFSGGMKIEFFLGPGIDFLSNLGNFPLRNGADVRSFGDILPD